MYHPRAQGLTVTVPAIRSGASLAMVNPRSQNNQRPAPGLAANPCNTPPLRMKTVRFGSAWAAFLLLLTGCGVGTESEVPSTPPLLPPLESIGIDLSFFQNRTPPAGVGTTVNWTTALERIAVAQSTVGHLLALPSATFHAASAQAPRRHGSAWHWSYSVLVDGVRHDGVLVGGINGAANAWHMSVSAPGRTPPLANQMIFEGISGFYGGSGQWLIPELGAAPGNLGTLQWGSLDPNAIGYTLNFDGGRWSYRRERKVHFLDYLTSDVAPRFRIWWDVETGRGAVAVGSGDNRCWNTQQLDMSCSDLAQAVRE